jgi:hypothetical protein
LIEGAVRVDRQCSQGFPRQLYSATPSPTATTKPITGSAE